MSNEGIKFAADVMLGRTARWLRMLGYDVFYRSKISDDELIFVSLIEGRIILTRDVKLARRAASATYLVRANDVWAQLREITNQFSIRPKLQLRRCPVCNGKILEVPKETIENLVPKYTFLTHKKFWQCEVCKKVFWRGSHIKLAQRDILNRITSAVGENDNENP